MLTSCWNSIYTFLFMKDLRFDLRFAHHYYSELAIEFGHLLASSSLTLSSAWIHSRKLYDLQCHPLHSTYVAVLLQNMISSWLTCRIQTNVGLNHRRYVQYWRCPLKAEFHYAIQFASWFASSELDSVMNLAYQALSSSLVAHELVADQLRTDLRPGSSYLDMPR